MTMIAQKSTTFPAITAGGGVSSINYSDLYKRSLVLLFVITLQMR